jgi:hypothetical protein
VSASGDSNPIERLKSLGSITEDQAGRSVFLLILLPIAQFAFGVTDLLRAAFDLFIVPLRSFIDGIGALILAVIGGAADIVNAGSGAAAQAFLTGIWGALGPFAYPAAIGTIVIGAFVLARGLQEQETSDTIFGLFSATDWPDLPLIGNIGAEEEDEEGDE